MKCLIGYMGWNQYLLDTDLLEVNKLCMEITWLALSVCECCLEWVKTVWSSLSLTACWTLPSALHVLTISIDIYLLLFLLSFNLRLISSQTKEAVGNLFHHFISAK